MELKTTLPTAPACLPGTSWMPRCGNEASTSQQADALKNISTLEKSLDSERTAPQRWRGNSLHSSGGAGGQEDTQEQRC